MNKQQLIAHLKQQGFSQRIIQAFENVNREDFVLKQYKEHAYQDSPLPIGYGQTISQPYTIAFMLDLLELKSNLNILEIGSGSGYVLGLINELSKNSEIYGIERIGKLVHNSKKVLKDKKNIKIIHGDGSKGLKKYGPYDRILISASAEEIPQKIISQLKFGGILVCVVKNSVYFIKRELKQTKIKEYPGFVFVPLVEG
tara:strand:+ start:219 stop:815 length:597 start_codon:yes stop_codon:yes gene_type:complete